MTHDFEYIGSFELTQPTMRVSDPCYERDVWCSNTLENCITGEWEASVVRDDSGYGVAMLAVRHIGGPQLSAFDRPYYNSNIEEAPFEAGVDSGQCGFFDERFYLDDHVCKEVSPEAMYDTSFGKPWYSLCCGTTQSNDRAGVIPYGAVSNTGGDGGFPVFLIRERNGHIAAAAVLFNYAVFKEDDEDSEDNEDTEY